MTLTYDGTYEGLLSAIFETYRLKITPEYIVPTDEWQPNMFEDPTHVATRRDWAERVLKGVRKKCSAKTLRLLYHAFLSEETSISMLIYTFVKKAMASPIDISDNYGDDTVIQLAKIKKKVGREVHRMHAFVRFQRTKDDIYYATIEPDFNVVPLLPPHFEKRYPAQQWLIYDTKRRYGIYYDKKQTEYITFADEGQLSYRQLSQHALETSEVEYQVLWKSYFDSVNIPERRNLKLHLQHVPKRYWKYLSEKRRQY